MRNFIFSLVILISASAPSALFADEIKSTQTVDELAARIIVEFPRAEGSVVAADENTAKFGIGSAAGLKPGMELFLVRPGRPIRHPVTKVILGTTEVELGKAVLTAVSEDESEGRIKDLKVTRVIPGDIGRLSTERTGLLIGVPATGYSEPVFQKLSGILKDSGRFTMKETAELKDAAPAPEDIKALLAKRGAEDLLVLSTAPATNKDMTAVELKLYSASGLKAQSAGIVQVGGEVYGETIMEHPIVRGERRDFFRMDELPYRARHLAGGSFTGPGKSEMAFSDGKKIIINRVDGGILKEVWREEGDPRNSHLDMECADLDGDGLDEIYVTNYTNDSMSSYVIKFDGVKFVRAAENMPVFFRVLDVPGIGKKLITTGLGAGSSYSGVIYEYKWKEGKLIKGGKFPLPSRVTDPYGFALMRTDAAAADAKKPLAGCTIFWIDDSDYLYALDSGGKKLWKSDDRYGGYDNFFETEKERSGENDNSRGKVKGKLVIRATAEGAKELVLTKNIPMTYITRRFRGYSGAEIYSFTWDGKELSQRWAIKNIDGFLADFFIGDASGEGRESIAIITQPTLKFEKANKVSPLGSAKDLSDVFADKSRLLIYKIPQR
jgi:hypothetical protein